MVEPQINSAIQCIQSAISLIDQGQNETVIRDSFTSYLRLIFPDNPRWLERHIHGGETLVRAQHQGRTRIGFVDNLVDLTAIEYESDLTNRRLFDDGYNQVRQYCASLINANNNPELVIGVLSDTIRWRAYTIRIINSREPGSWGPDDIELQEIDYIDLSTGDLLAARRLIDFLIKYLGRIGARRLVANSIANDLGLDSRFARSHIANLNTVIVTAFSENRLYSDLIRTLWGNLVSYVRSANSLDSFDRDEYISELYLITLAKLLCANIIQHRAIISNDFEIARILDGNFFKERGLENLVEYDHFGWLNQDPLIESLIPIANQIQEDLRAYDYTHIASDDLFGHLMAQLAQRSRRLLLGQECTPQWLANLIVQRVIERLPHDETPQLVDMCCGSGAMIVSTICQVKERIELEEGALPQYEKIEKLSWAITGFDIDPLAVLFSKINWVLAAGEWLEPYGTYPVTIPIYNADSLSAITSISNILEDREGQEFLNIRIADRIIQLPIFLISHEFQKPFDKLVDCGYQIALSFPDSDEIELDNDTLNASLSDSFNESEREPSAVQYEAARVFLSEFISNVHQLNRQGLNGIWAFILRNNYRPGLVAGHFNGLVSNPPWLALSKIADNPYATILTNKSERFGIKPSGSSFLHIEMATIFILHAVDRYLKPDGIIGCVAPETILNGDHHSPFRDGNYAVSQQQINFEVNEIWRVEDHTFKNNAIVLFGSKTPFHPEQFDPFPGHLATRTGLSPLSFYRSWLGDRTAWSELGCVRRNTAVSVTDQFRQGADIMPRTFFFHEITRLPGRRIRWSVNPIDPSTSSLAYALEDVKKFTDFRLPPCIAPDDYIFDVLLSKHLTPFDLSQPLKTLLPIRKNPAGIWEPMPLDALAARNISTPFTQMANMFGTDADISVIWNSGKSGINFNNKLVCQNFFEPGRFFVFYGAGGGIVCSTFAPTESFNLSKIIIDQTLYYTVVETSDEAIYLTGLLNCEAIYSVIKIFQPRGDFGARHIHKLAPMVIPQYDRTIESHQNVVLRTRQLLEEYHALKITDDELRRNLDPNYSNIQTRRPRIRRKITQLPSYLDYEEACSAIFDID
ncbi:MAG: N-6 DNA methylase [Methanoregula sp.]